MAFSSLSDFTYVTTSRSTHDAANDTISFFFYGWVIFYSVCVAYLFFFRPQNDHESIEWSWIGLFFDSTWGGLLPWPQPWYATAYIWELTRSLLFREEEVVAQRSHMTCPRSHSLQEKGLALNPERGNLDIPSVQKDDKEASILPDTAPGIATWC